MNPDPVPVDPARSIDYDPAVLRAELLDVLEELTGFFQTAPVREALGRDALRPLREGEGEIRTRLEGDFTLAVIGDFKRGKSTLINAVLGTTLVPTSATPETVTINEITYGPALRVEARLRDGGRLSIQPDELASDRLTPLLAPLDDRLSHLRIEAPVERLRGLRLVDTPGTGDVLNRFDDRVQSYLTRADALLYVLSAVSPLSETEQAFLRMSVAPHEFPRLLFVMNMMDVASTSADAERLLASVRAKLERTFPFARLFGVSALDELARKLGRSRPSSERATDLAAGFDALRAALNELVEIHRSWIQLDRGAQQALTIIERLRSHAERLHSALLTDATQLRQAIEECEDRKSELHRRLEARQNEVRDAIAGMGRQTAAWLDEFLDRWEVEVVPVLAGYELDDLRQHFAFFVADTLRQAVNQCVEAHQPAVGALVSEAEASIRRDYRRLTGSDAAEAQVGRAASASVFGDLPWTPLDSIHMFIELALGGVYALLMELFKTHATHARHLEAFQDRVKEGLPSLREAVQREVAQVYANLGREAETHIQAAYDEELQSTLAALHHAEELAGQGSSRIGTSREVLTDVVHRIEEARHQIVQIRRRLRAEE